MTARPGWAQGADQWFGDALSGSDGMADPAPTMPLLDVYADALSAPMPPPDARRDVIAAQSGVAAAPTARDDQPQALTGRGGVPSEQRRRTPQAPAARQPQRPRGERLAGMQQRPAGQTPRSASLAVAQPDPTVWQATGRRSGSGVGPAPAHPSHAAPSVTASFSPTPSVPAPPARSSGTGSWHAAVQSFQMSGKSMSASDALAIIRQAAAGRGVSSGTTGRPVGRMPAQHLDHAHGATPPGAVNQPSMRQIRDQARRQGRRRSSGSSVIAVLVLMVVVLMASGLGERLIGLLQELLQR